jgi:hypothetical protein
MWSRARFPQRGTEDLSHTNVADFVLVSLRVIEQ